MRNQRINEFGGFSLSSLRLCLVAGGLSAFTLYRYATQIPSNQALQPTAGRSDV